MPKLYPEDRKFSVRQVYAREKGIKKTAKILQVSKQKERKRPTALGKLRAYTRFHYQMEHLLGL